MSNNKKNHTKQRRQRRGRGRVIVIRRTSKTKKNQKVRTTDEFLVKKRQPLALPPDYQNLPKPGSKSLDKENERNEINKINDSSFLITFSYGRGLQASALKAFGETVLFFLERDVPAFLRAFIFFTKDMGSPILAV